MFLLNFSKLPFDFIFPNLILDLFFEPPFTVFCLLFIITIYFLLKKYNHIEYTFLFWLVPFFLYNYRFNDLIVTSLTGHGLNTTPQLQNVVCIFIKPDSDGLKINKNFGSQIDIFPTILDYLKLEPSIERYEQGQSLDRNDLASRPIYLSSMKSYALVENGYFFEFRDKNSPNFKVTKLDFSDSDLKPTYQTLSNWPDHNEIYEKYKRVKKFFTIQKEFLNQIK